MDTKEIQHLIDFIAQTGLESVKIKTDALDLEVKRSAAAPAPVTMALPAMDNMPTPAATPAAPAAPAAVGEEGLETIKSPMIGTFYRSPNPESPAFVQEGDAITTGKPVCMIEAMKLFNEIESELSGTIVKILVEDASPVEFDQPLFLVKPN